MRHLMIGLLLLGMNAQAETKADNVSIDEGVIFYQRTIVDEEQAGKLLCVSLDDSSPEAALSSIDWTNAEQDQPKLVSEMAIPRKDIGLYALVSHAVRYVCDDTRTQLIEGAAQGVWPVFNLVEKDRNLHEKVVAGYGKTEVDSPLLSFDYYPVIKFGLDPWGRNAFIDAMPEPDGRLLRNAMQEMYNSQYADGYRAFGTHEVGAFAKTLESETHEKSPRPGVHFTPAINVADARNTVNTLMELMSLRDGGKTLRLKLKMAGYLSRTDFDMSKANFEIQESPGFVTWVGDFKLNECKNNEKKEKSSTMRPSSVTDVLNESGISLLEDLVQCTFTADSMTSYDQGAWSSKRKILIETQLRDVKLVLDQRKAEVSFHAFNNMPFQFRVAIANRTFFSDDNQAELELARGLIRELSSVKENASEGASSTSVAASLAARKEKIRNMIQDVNEKFLSTATGTRPLLHPYDVVRINIALTKEYDKLDQAVGLKK